MDDMDSTVDIWTGYERYTEAVIYNVAATSNPFWKGPIAENSYGFFFYGLVVNSAVVSDC